jgi:antitoxin (DNA-binding transcriptional repressor) of toxin-antitoxin stability system
MSTTVSVSEARAALPDILELVRTGNEVTLTRHGVPVAVIVRPDALRGRRADQALAAAMTVHEVIQQGRRSALKTRPTMSRERADALVEELRTTRSRG